MSFKVLNNLAKPNDLVSIFLIFGIYFCITDMDIFLFTINLYSITIHKTKKEVKISHIFY